MWQIIGWIIWSLITFLGIAGIYYCRKSANSEQGLDFISSTYICCLWLISILFLVSDWNKLHIIWSAPIILFLIPTIIRKNVPVISSIMAYSIGAFLTVILAKTKANLLDEDMGREQTKKQMMKHDFQKRYKRFCEINRKLIDKMMEHVPEFVMKKAAKDLNLTGPRGIILFDTEAETCFLGDRCLYDIPWIGKNVITHFMESEDYQLLAEDEKAVVQGMTQAYYSLFEVLSTEPSEGMLEFNDLLKPETYTITDYNLSRTAHPGDLLATRIRPAGDIYTTTGAVCPFRNEHKQNLLNGLEPKRIPGKKKPKKIPPSDYSVYFFRKYKRTEGMEYVVVDERC